MAIVEEIEQIKSELAQTTSPDSNREAEAELLLVLLKKYSSINSTEGQPYIDRLLHLAEKMASTRYRAWGLYNLGIINYLKGEYDAALNLTQQALSLFGQLSDKQGLANTFNNTGIIYKHQGNYAEALKNYLHALQIREETGDKRGIAVLYNNIGIIYKEQGNYPEALKNYLRSLQIKEETGDKHGIATAYNNIGIIHHDQGNYAEALKSYLQALQIGEEIGDQQKIASAYNSIGNIHIEQGNYAEGLKNYLPGLQIAESTGDKHRIGNSYNNIGTTYKAQGNYPEAMKNHLHALDLAEEIGDKSGIADAHFGIGEVHEKQGHHPEAVKNKLRALQLAEEIGRKGLIKQACLSLFQSYKSIRDAENALKYYEKYHQLENEILGKQVQTQLSNLNFQRIMELKEKETEINRLRNVELKGALDNLRIEKDRSETLLLNILPGEVAEELKEKGTAGAKLFDDVSVLFTDFKDFTKVSERLTPQQLVDELHACFSAFDKIMAKYNIEKIKTVGDAYLAVSGLPLANPNHAGDLVKAAIEIRDFMLNRKQQTASGKPETFEIRIGVHSGSVVAGIVGIKKFAYDIWGDTVNTAARMEQNSLAGKINISGATFDLLKDKFVCEYRGEIEVKNKGKLKMYFVS